MKFGTSGLRGLVSDLKGRASALYTQAFTRHLILSGAITAGATILVGRDHRPSSDEIAATCIGALKRAGMKPVDCGVIPTPALALFGRSINAAALMVTGSHIPSDRNGIKFYRPDGEIDKADEAGIAAIAEKISNSTIDFTPGRAIDQSAEASALFLKRNLRLLPTGALHGLKIGVYQHSTVARDSLVDVLQRYGAEVIAFAKSDTFVPVDTEAISPETAAILRRFANEYSVDAIVSADGDGDRPLVADEFGNPLRGDFLGLVAARFLGADLIVTPVTSNSGIENVVACNVVRTRVGSPFVIAGMQDAVDSGFQRVVGFEANGGTLTASAFQVGDNLLEPLPTRDSFLPTLAVLHLKAERQKPLSYLAASFGLPAAAAGRLENFDVATSKALLAHLRASESNLTAFLGAIGGISGWNDLDGLRVVLADGNVVHLRPSGNAPEIRLYVEARTELEAEALLQSGLDSIRRWSAEL